MGLFLVQARTTPALSKAHFRVRPGSQVDTMTKLYENFKQ